MNFKSAYSFNLFLCTPPLHPVLATSAAPPAAPDSLLLLVLDWGAADAAGPAAAAISQHSSSSSEIATATSVARTELNFAIICGFACAKCRPPELPKKRRNQTVAEEKQRNGTQKNCIKSAYTLQKFNGLLGKRKRKEERPQATAKKRKKSRQKVHKNWVGRGRRLLQQLV